MVGRVVLVVFGVEIHADDMVAEFVEDRQAVGGIALEVGAAVIGGDEAEDG